MSRWRRRVLAEHNPDNPDGPLKQIASSCVSAHHGQLYCIFELRWDDGRRAIVARLSGEGYGRGPWKDTVLDLQTAREFTVSSEDPDVEARKLTIADFPPALLAVWPHDRAGRPLTPGWAENGRCVDAKALRAIARQRLNLQPPQLSLFG